MLLSLSILDVYLARNISPHSDAEIIFPSLMCWLGPWQFFEVDITALAPL